MPDKESRRADSRFLAFSAHFSDEARPMRSAISGAFTSVLPGLAVAHDSRGPTPPRTQKDSSFCVRSFLVAGAARSQILRSFSERFVAKSSSIHTQRRSFPSSWTNSYRFLGEPRLPGQKVTPLWKSGSGGVSAEAALSWRSSNPVATRSMHTRDRAPAWGAR